MVTSKWLNASNAALTFPSLNKLGLRFPFCERERDLSVFQQAGNLIQLADIPLVSQSDHGSENYGIVKAQTALHHWHDPSLAGNNSTLLDATKEEYKA